jgi:hypothetical protein
MAQFPSWKIVDLDQFLKTNYTIKEREIYIYFIFTVKSWIHEKCKLVLIYQLSGSYAVFFISEKWGIFLEIATLMSPLTFKCFLVFGYMCKSDKNLTSDSNVVTGSPTPSLPFVEVAVVKCIKNLQASLSETPFWFIHWLIIQWGHHSSSHHNGI